MIKVLFSKPVCQAGWLWCPLQFQTPHHCQEPEIEKLKKLQGPKRKSHLSINNARPPPWGPISSHVLSFKSLFSSQESHPLSCKTPAFFSPPLNTYHKIWKRIGYFHWCLSVSSQIPPIITFMITFNVELLFREESILLMVTAQRSRCGALTTSKAMEFWQKGTLILQTSINIPNKLEGTASVYIHLIWISFYDKWEQPLYIQVSKTAKYALGLKRPVQISPNLV